uniref:Ribonuclease n=1 Tax=Kalanchoe fedtschenkoi TaxID=63787 RepID=A0A7N0V7V1_KALFE
MGSEEAKWASEPCIMGIDEAGRGPVLGPMVYGCLYCARSYQDTLSTLQFADSKTLKEEKREELYEILKAERAIGWAVDVIDPRELSAKMLKKEKINLNQISHTSAMGLVSTVLGRGVLLTEVYVDTVGDPEKYRIRLSEKFPDIKFVVAKKADSLYPVVSGASIVAKVTRDRALKEWVMDETCESMHRSFGSGYPGGDSCFQHHSLFILCLFLCPMLFFYSENLCPSGGRSKLRGDYYSCPEIRKPKPGWKTTNMHYLDSQHWFVSVGVHALLTSKRALKFFGKLIKWMKMIQPMAMERGN